MLPILLSLLAVSSAAQPTKRQDGKPVFMPLKYPYNGYPKVYADIYFGTPEQTPIETVVDLGSADYWVRPANTPPLSPPPPLTLPTPRSTAPTPPSSTAAPTSASKAPAT